MNGLDKRIKKLFFSLEDRFPALGKEAIKVARRVRAGYYRLAIMTRRLQGKVADAPTIIEVSPDDIVYCRAANLRKERGVIADGDWDVPGRRFEETVTYLGMHDRFVLGQKWQDTEYYKQFVERIKAGEKLWHCADLGAFHKRLNKLDALFADMKENGYRRQSDDYRVDVYHGKHDQFYEKDDEVAINISRKGRPLFADGGHRLSMAKILGLKKIPVAVIKRHAKWVAFRNEVKNFAEKLPGGMLYQTAYHPDLADIPYAHGGERWPAIRDSIKTRKGKVLDIGANFGLFCYKLERAFGLDCLAVEVNPQEVYFAKKLRDSVDANFTVRTQSVFDLSQDEVGSFDVVLALYIFHHFLKRKSEFEKLVEFLNNLNCHELFLGVHNPKEVQMEGVYKNFMPEEFVDFVAKEANLRNKELILKAKGGRAMYRLST